MKNLHKLLLTSAFICSGAVSYASSNGHFYVGGQVGVLHGEPYTKTTILDYSDPHEKINLVASYSKTWFSGGVFGGYNHPISFGSVSLEFFASREKTHFKQDKGLLQSTNGAFDVTSHSSNLEKNNSWGLSLKSIWDLKRAPIKIYGSFSVLTSDFMFNYKTIAPSANDNATGQQTRSLWAFAPGLGATYDFNNKTGIRLDYQYRFYQDWNLRNVNDLGKISGLTGTLKIRDQSFTIGFIYKFSKI